MTQKELLYKLDAYILGHMSEPERISFEAELRENPLWQAQLNSQKSQLNAFEILVQEDLKTKITEWRYVRPWWKKPFYQVCLLASLGFIGVFLIKTIPPARPQSLKENPEMNTKPLDTVKTKIDTSVPNKSVVVNTQTTNPPKQVTPMNKKITLPNPPDASHKARPVISAQNVVDPIMVEYAEAYQKELLNDINDVSILKGDAEDSSDFKQAGLMIKRKSYDSAQILLRHIPQQVNYYTDVRFALAAIHYVKKEYAKAIVGFELLIKENSYILRDNAKWYLALSYLANGQKIQAMTILENIAHAEGNNFQLKAADLLIKLKNK